jgi:hypothetical protein
MSWPDAWYGYLEAPRGAERGLLVGAPKGSSGPASRMARALPRGAQDREAVGGGPGTREKEWYLLKRGGKSKWIGTLSTP